MRPELMRIGNLTVFTIVFSLSVFAQLGGDLGGSTGVFRPKNPTAKKTPPVTKKTAPEPIKPAVKNTKTAKPVVKNTPPIIKATTAKTPVAAKSRKSVQEQFESQIENGNTARDNRDFPTAEKSYKQAAKLLPKDSRAVYGLGNIYIDQQLWDAAEKSYRDAVKLDPADANAFIALSYVLVQPNRGGKIAERLNEAERFARRAVQLQNDNAVAFDQLGVSLETRGVIDSETENAYRRAIELDPNFAIAYAHLGRILRKNGRKNEALAAYKSAVEKAGDVPTLILVAEVLQTEQRFSESESLLRKAVEMDATNPTALLLLGRALSIQRNYLEAEKFLLESIRISPRSFQAYSVLGTIYLRMSRFEDAEKIYLQGAQVGTAIERKQLAGAYGLTGVGDAYLQLGKTADALRVYRKAAEFDTDNVELKNKIAEMQAGKQ